MFPMQANNILAGAGITVSPSKMGSTTPTSSSVSAGSLIGNVYNLSNHSVGENSNSSTVSNMTTQNTIPNVYSQNHGNISSAVAKMAAVNIYNTHIGNNTTKMGNMFHSGNHTGAKMAAISNVFHTGHQQDSQDSVDRSTQPSNNPLMGSYHVPSYVPGGLPMGSMGYYIPPIHHADPNMDMLHNRMANNQ
jgi:hypothetical protein